MPDWNEAFQYLKDFFDTLAGKLTAILAFALLVVIVLGAVGASIPVEYRWLVYIVVIGAMLIFAMQAILQVAKMRNKHVPESGSPDPKPTPSPTESVEPVPPVDPMDAREKYLRFIIKECSSMRLVGLDPSASDPNRGGMSLEKLYISLDTRTPKEKLKDVVSGEKESLSALGAWTGSDKRRMVLLGLPGTGKSTFVRYLALCMAKACLLPETELPEGWKGKPLIPFMISLGRFSETIPPDCRSGNAEMIEEYLVQSLQKDACAGSFAASALTELTNAGALVMFDGLDEVANMKLRPVVVQAITDFVEKYGRISNNYYLVTCRTFSYRNDAAWKLTGWETHELALLSRSKIEYFVNAWYSELGTIERSRVDEYERKRKELLENLQPGDRRRLIDIAAFPLAGRTLCGRNNKKAKHS